MGTIIYRGSRRQVSRKLGKGTIAEFLCGLGFSRRYKFHCLMAADSTEVDDSFQFNRAASRTFYRTDSCARERKRDIKIWSERERERERFKPGRLNPKCSKVSSRVLEGRAIGRATRIE